MPDFVLGAVLLLLTGGIVILVIRVNALERRYLQFRDEMVAMIALHQDIASNHEDRLQRLGSAGMRVPTAREMTAWASEEPVPIQQNPIR